MTKRRQDPRGSEAETASVRLDLWLWTARFHKTRALAAEAVDGGKVELNGQRPKRAHPVRPGDQLRIRLGPYEHVVTIRGLAPRRGPATEAVLLYVEDADSIARREALALTLKATAALFNHEAGKPSKKDRRERAKWKGKE
jgi:ribosome-associated heat shock protein Hsp15